MYRHLSVLLVFTIFFSSTNANANVNTNECLDEMCSEAVTSCKEAGLHSHDCWQWADEIFNCCHHCNTCRRNDTEVEVTKIGECHPKMCTMVFDVCNKIHPNASTDCMERADEATNCCYSCLDCPESFEVRNSEEHHECQEQMCSAIQKACVHTDHNPEECQDISNEAAHCCDECNNCNLEKHHKKHHRKMHRVKKHHCEPTLCKKTYDACRSLTHEHKDCWALADDEYNCCGHCHDC